jgi:methylenetetrahydrofolate dehydrogenase (NADP+)/methenyltetrahydrofolate cyclohydrolase
MSVIIKGADVAAAMKEKLINDVEKLKTAGFIPRLGIVRVGGRPDDLAYERGAVKKLSGLGIDCRVFDFPETITRQDFIKNFSSINSDPRIHGILLFRPLPKHLDESEAINLINPLKDIDCMSPVNIAKVFSGNDTGFAPCTPEAVVETLSHSGIDIEGKRVVIVGRSMVVGRPLSMLLLKRNATVSICHTRTMNLVKVCKSAEILIAAAGKAKMITEDFVSRKTAVIDVGINIDENGNLCGDVDFDSVLPKASHITPVPGGIGAVTSSVLAKHVVRAAQYLNDRFL